MLLISMRCKDTLSDGVSEGLACAMAQCGTQDLYRRALLHDVVGKTRLEHRGISCSLREESEMILETSFRALSAWSE